VGLYNFQERFVGPIEAGAKRQTIRAFRKRQDGPGSILHLYTGLRHKGARLLMRVECTWASEIRIEGNGSIVVDGNTLTPWECQALARHDGFADYGEMMSFWKGRLPFEGQIIGWGPALEAAAVDPRPHLARDRKLEAERCDALRAAEAIRGEPLADGWPGPAIDLPRGPNDPRKGERGGPT
jgi:hypothetical protein